MGTFSDDVSYESDTGGHYSWSRPVDARIADIATTQHGSISWDQLRGCGLSPRQIRYRVAIGRLHVIHYKVYAVGHDGLTQHGRWMAATLAGGIGATLSHRSAATLWGITVSPSRVVDVTVRSWHRKEPGIRFHTAEFDYDETTEVRGIRVTGPSRTLLDLGQVLEADALERAFREAERLQLTDVYSVADLLERYPRKRGCAVVRRIGSMRELYRGVTRSELEERFRQFLLAQAMPDPEWNVQIELPKATLEVDCLWRERGVIVELDGYGYHAGLDAFERDRLRDRQLQLAGFRVLRITWRALSNDPTVPAALRALVA